METEENKYENILFFIFSKDVSIELSLRVNITCFKSSGQMGRKSHNMFWADCW